MIEYIAIFGSYILRNAKRFIAYINYPLQGMHSIFEVEATSRPRAAKLDHHS